MEKTIIDTKNNLLNMLNGCDNESLFTNMETVITTIELTSGLWIELEYAYKACELMQIILDRCNHMQSYSRLHHKTVEKIESIKRKAYKTQDFMHQNKTF